jgi:hypothetical protein
MKYAFFRGLEFCTRKGRHHLRRRNVSGVAVGVLILANKPVPKGNRQNCRPKLRKKHSEILSIEKAAVFGAHRSADKCGGP